MSAFDSFSKLLPIIGDEGMFAKKLLNLKHCYVFTQPYHQFKFCWEEKVDRGNYKIIAEIVGWPHIIQNWIRSQNAFNQSSPWWPWERYFIITGYLQNISKRSKFCSFSDIAQCKNDSLIHFVYGIVLLRPLPNYLICWVCNTSLIFIGPESDH